jgi:hypothetical protein
MMMRRLLLPLTVVGLLASCGESPESPGGTMVISVTQPPAGNVDADSNFTIVWETTGALDGAKVTLTYDVDCNPAGSVLITNNLPASGTYDWMCADIPEGTYYIRALVAAGISTASDFSAGTVTLSHPWAGPQVNLLTPPSGGAMADSSFDIAWVTSGFTDPTISLYYDNDTIPDDTLLIVKGLEDTGLYTWPCIHIGAGEYYLYAVATGSASDGSGIVSSISRIQGRDGGSRGPVTATDFSDGILTISHGGELPQITILTPPAAGDTANTSFNIEWTSLTSGSTTIDLYYDTDTISGTGLKQIASHLPDSLTSYDWDCSGINEGAYYIYGLIKDVSGNSLGAFRNTGTDYSEGTVLIDHSSGYSFSITAPPAGGASADTLYQIAWDTDAPDSLTLDLYYTADTTGSEFFQVTMHTPNDGFFDWDCSDAAEGDWFVFGVLQTESDTLYDFSDGLLTIGHDSTYSMEVTAPPAGGASADTSYTIEWTATGPSGSVVDLFYDVDTDPTNMTNIVHAMDNTGTYDWNTSVIAEGSYYIYAYIQGETDGSGGILRRLYRGGASDYSDGTLTIDHDIAYTLEVTDPPLAGAQADSSYLVKWITDAPTAVTLDLWYAADTVGVEVFPIATGVPSDANYQWDTSTVPEGDWYVYGALMLTDGSTDWSPGLVSVSHVEWSMEVTAPPAAGASADSTYMIEWTAEGGTTAVVDLYYDVDTDPAEMVLIKADLDNSGSYEWNTLTVSQGDWYVYAVIRPHGTDTDNPQGAYASDYSDGKLTVTHSDFYILVTTPPEWGAEADSIFHISWAAFAPPGSDVDIFYDTDTDPASGLIPIIDHLDWDLFTYLWVCDAVAEGEYYVYAELHDGASTTADYSDSTLIIEHDPLFVWITSPGASGDTADQSYTIRWLSEGPDERVIDLYYDTDKEPSSGLVSIIEGLASPLHNSAYTWDCSGVPDGTYYILGVLWDSIAGGDSTSHYSVGALTIQH